MAGSREAYGASEAARLPVLDGLRGIAILLVMQQHFYGLPFGFANWQATNELDRTVKKVFATGWIGVDLFFVLSGFLITGILLRSLGGAGFFRSFYARRALRIFPLYYGFIAFVLFVLPHLGWLQDQAKIDEVRENQWWFWTYLVNVPDSFTSIDGSIPFVHSHFWSLAVEEQFYLVWPAIVLLLGARWLPHACVAIIAGALILRITMVTEVFPGTSGIAHYLLMPARMDSLALGALVAVMVDQGMRLPTTRTAALVAGGALAVVVAMFVVRDGFLPGDEVAGTLGMTLVAIMFAGLLLVVLQAPAASFTSRLVASSPLTFLGRYAYGLYVLHVLVAFTMAARWSETNMLRTVGGSQIPAAIVFSLAATAVSVALAYGVWHLYEGQILKLKRFFPYGRAADRRGPMATTPAGEPAIPAP